MTGAAVHLHNPRRSDDAVPPAEVRVLIGGEAAARARRVIHGWPGYRPTPLRSSPGLASHLGVAEIWCKDESGRFGLGSFKALGGAYAVYRVLAERIRSSGGSRRVDVDSLIAGEFAELTSPVSVCAASAGNHGRSVAWAAHLFGCRCRIYVPASTDARRVKAIEDLGSEVVRVRGTYDETVRRAAADPAAEGWTVISDTAYDGNTAVPLEVMRGYTVLADEIVQQWTAPDPPTHVFLQCGVGGLAAAVCEHLWERWGAARPRVVIAEPERAACMLESARAGELTAVDGPLETHMTCLACGEASAPAWEVLRGGADDFIRVGDEQALEAVRLLAKPELLDPAIRTAPSGAAGLGALLTAARHPSLAAELGLGGGSRVLLIVSEGAGD